MRRYLPRRPLPPYAYIPGHDAPHPTRDPAGHSRDQPAPPPLDPDRWWRSEEYLWAFDLYNHGYPWEAHEAWEGLWQQAPAGPDRELLQGLIQCAAAAVQLRRGRPEGARRLTGRALSHIAPLSGEELLGVRLGPLVEALRRFAAGELTELPALDLPPPAD